MGADSLKVGLKWSLVELQVTASGSSQPLNLCRTDGELA